MYRRFCGHAYTSWWTNGGFIENGSYVVGDRITRCCLCGEEFNIDQLERAAAKKRQVAALLAAVEETMACMKKTETLIAEFKARWLTEADDA